MLIIYFSLVIIDIFHLRSSSFVLSYSLFLVLSDFIRSRAFICCFFFLFVRFNSFFDSRYLFLVCFHCSLCLVRSFLFVISHQLFLVRSFSFILSFSLFLPGISISQCFSFVLPGLFFFFCVLSDLLVIDSHFLT